MAAKKVSKQTKKFGRKHLDQKIKSRKEFQARRKNIDQKNSAKRRKSLQKVPAPKNGAGVDGEEDSDGVEENDGPSGTLARIDTSVDALLDAQGLESEDEEGEEEDPEDDDDLNSIISSGGVSNTGMDLEKLKRSDPEFYKYLEENDKALLDFDADEDLAALDEVEELKGSGAKNQEAKSGKRQETQAILTCEVLRTWKKAIIETRSMRALRKLLLAWKAAASGANDTNAELPYRIESSAVFHAVVATTTRYLPMFLQQVLPVKEKPDGKIKLAKHTKLYSTTQRILKLYFTSLAKLIPQLPSHPSKDDIDVKDSLLHAAIGQTAKLTPWILGNPKIARSWIKILVEVWASSPDQVRVAAILALGRVTAGGSDALVETTLKGLYTSLIRSSKNTTAFTLPSITLMKNSAAEIYKVHPQTSYPLVFKYLRQLAIHLRNSLKLKTQEGFQAVYNWQFIHSLDFWSLVLSSACDKTVASGSESQPLKPLIYPLVQVTTGVIRLIPTARYYPLRFHCVRLLLRLSQRTGTFIPLAPFMIDVIDSPLFKRRTKPSSLKPLDWEYLIKCPKTHEHSRVYADGAAEESLYLLLEYYSTWSRSIAFPELALPALVMLKKLGKNSSSPKLVSILKSLIDKLEANRSWIESRRATVDFGPNSIERADNFLQGTELSQTPLGSYHRLQAKVRSQKFAAIEKSLRTVITED